MSRGSFGFKGVNGNAIKLVVTKKVSDKVMTKLAPKRLRQSVVAAMNRAGKAAERAAKSPEWTPRLTGRLIRSIRWEKARQTLKGNIVRGNLWAGGTDVPYARIQEFTNRRLPFFLRRAINEVAQPAFLAELRGKKIWEDLLIGGRRFGG